MNCHHCGKQNHIQLVCRFKQQGKPNQPVKGPEVHDVDDDAYQDILTTFEVCNVRKKRNNISVDLDVDGKPLKMELDMGSAVSIILLDLYQHKFKNTPLQNLDCF